MAALTEMDGWDISATMWRYTDGDRGWNNRLLFLSYRVSGEDVVVYGKNYPDLTDQLD